MSPPERDANAHRPNAAAHRLALGAVSTLVVAAGLGVAAVPPRAVPPLAWAAPALLLAAGWLLRAVRRAHGWGGAWLVALALSVLLGELSAVAIGGQSGRLLWADAVVLGGVAAVLVRRGAVLEVPRDAVLGWTLALVAWSALTLPFAGDALTAIAELKEWVIALLAGVVAHGVLRRADRARVALGAVAVTGAAIGVLMLVAALRSPLGPVIAIALKRVDLPWGRSNYLAGILILSLAVGLGLAAGAVRRRERWAWIGVTLLCALGVAASASKGAALALILGLLVAYVPAGRAARAGLVALAALLIAGGALFVLGPLSDVLAYRAQQSALAYSVGERGQLYALAWDRFQQAPLTGLGLNNFSVAAHRLTGVDTVPHNFALGFLAELGVIGMVIAVGWLFAVLAAARRAARHAVGRDRAVALAVWAGVAAFAVHNQVESTIYGEQMKLLLVLVLAAAGAWRAPDRSAATS